MEQFAAVEAVDDTPKVDYKSWVVRQNQRIANKLKRRISTSSTPIQYQNKQEAALRTRNADGLICPVVLNKEERRTRHSIPDHRYAKVKLPRLIQPSDSAIQSSDTLLLIPTISRKNEIWNYFRFPPGGDKSTVVCHLCHQEIKYYKSLYNLKAHLTADHPNMELGKNLVCFHNKQKMISLCLLSRVTVHYALSLDRWEDEGQTGRIQYWLTLSINLANAELKDSDNIIVRWDEALHCIDGLYLEHCTAVIVNFFDEQHIEEYFGERNIPVVPCLLSVIQHAVAQCYQLPEIKEVIDEATCLLRKCGQLPRTKISPDFWIRQWNMLDYFCSLKSSLSTHSVDDTSSIFDLVTEIVEMLRPLETALHTLTKNRTPTIGLAKPIVTDLINNHLNKCVQQYVSEDPVESLGETIYSIVIHHLEVYLIKNKILQFSHFFDPRFRRTCTDIESAHILSAVCSNTKKNNELTVEIDKYLKETHLWLPQKECPIVWWTEHASIYPHLKREADKYLCIPIGIRIHEHIIGASVGPSENGKQNLVDGELVRREDLKF